MYKHRTSLSASVELSMQSFRQMGMVLSFNSKKDFKKRSSQTVQFLKSLTCWDVCFAEHTTCSATSTPLFNFLETLHQIFNPSPNHFCDRTLKSTTKITLYWLLLINPKCCCPPTHSPLKALVLSHPHSSLEAGKLLMLTPPIRLLHLNRQNPTRPKVMRNIQDSLPILSSPEDWTR